MKLEFSQKPKKAIFYSERLKIVNAPKEFKPAIDATFKELSIARQIFLTNSFTGLREKSTQHLVTETRSQADGHTDRWTESPHNSLLFLLRKDRLKW